MCGDILLKYQDRLFRSGDSDIWNTADISIQDLNDSTKTTSHTRIAGPPKLTPPDVPLYLGIGR